MLGIQDARANGYDWVKAEYERLLEDLDRDANYFNVIRIAKEQLEQEERVAVQEQKIAEVDEMALPFDFDADFGTVGVNQIVRQMLKEERAKNFAEFNVEFDRIQAETAEKIRGYEEREVILERQNTELQNTINEIGGVNAELANQNAEQHAKIIDLTDKLFDTESRLKEIEQNRDNAARIILERDAEIERLESQLDEMRRAALIGERQAQRVIEVNQTTKDLYEQAKQATAEKRQVIVTGNIGANFLTVENPDKSTDVIHVSAIDRQEVEVVTEFLDLPAIETPVEPSTIGIEHDVEESPVVFGGIETPSEGDLVEEVREAAFQSAETPQETAHSEEVGETFEQEMRRRIGNLEQTIFGYVDGQEAA